MTAPTILKKAVLVHAPEFDDGFCNARLRITHDRVRKTGSISIQIPIDIAGPSSGPRPDMPGGSRSLLLNIRPEMVDTCAIALKSNDNLIPTRLLTVAPALVTKSSAMSTMTLCLNTTGVVLKPIEANLCLNGASLIAFSKICRAQNIRLHISSRQLRPDEQTQLETFSRALRTHDLKAEQFDLTRFDAGRGAEETDWRVFDQLDPPTYVEVVSQNNVLGKRPRAKSRSSSPREITPKKAFARLPSYSPTILNTPTTTTSSPSRICPTKFTNCEFREEDKITRIQQELKDIPDHMIREMLIKSGHQHLLAKLEEPIPEPVPKPNAVTMEQVDKMIEQRLNQFIDQRLTSLTKATFKSLTQTQLDSLVESQLPVAAEIFLNTAVAKHRDNFYEDCKTNSANLREEVDEGITELRDVANECCKEIQEKVQQCLHDYEADTLAEDRVCELKHWIVNFTKGVLDKEKIRQTSDPLVRARRSSL